MALIAPTHCHKWRCSQPWWASCAFARVVRAGGGPFCPSWHLGEVGKCVVWDAFSLPGLGSCESGVSDQAFLSK